MNEWAKRTSDSLRLEKIPQKNIFDRERLRYRGPRSDSVGVICDLLFSR